MTLRPATLAVLATVLVVAPVSAYLEFGTSVGGGNVTVRWTDLPVRYFVTDRGVPGVTAFDFQAAFSRAFSTWESVSSSSVRFEFVGFTGANSSDEDGMTTTGFESRPELERVLGATTILLDDKIGAILEAGIFINSTFPWSVASAGEPGRFDLESIALHEIGHLAGLGHSALGETELRPGGGRRVIASGAVMFPIAFAPGTTIGRTLRPDDIAGMSDLYPAGDFRSATGTISGRVTRNGAGVLGAHVVAFDPATGTLVGNISIDDEGRYATAGLAPGLKILRVEPLDDVDDGDILREETDIDTDFKVTYGDRVVIVPRGGNFPIDVRVEPK